jgi:hypothetical protein
MSKKDKIFINDVELKSEAIILILSHFFDKRISYLLSGGAIKKGIANLIDAGLADYSQVGLMFKDNTTNNDFHCELHDFGRKDKACEIQCDGCKAMLPTPPPPPKARIIVEGKKPQTLHERLK